jgi:hypothetical protein
MDITHREFIVLYTMKALLQYTITNLCLQGKNAETILNLKGLCHEINI